MTEALNGLYSGLGYGDYGFSYYRPEESYLEEKLEGVVDKQGVIGDIWNGFKEITGLGFSQSDCEKMLEKYKNGEMSFEDALEEIEKYESKQTAFTSLATNLATGAAAIGLTIASAGTGPIGWAVAFKFGAPIGAAVKSAIGILDRSTNDVEGDALNAKNIAKDAISGALTGAASAVSSGVSEGLKVTKDMSAEAIKEGLRVSVRNGIRCGVECGAMSGAVTYTTNSIIDGTEFRLGELAQETATSALVSGAVGGVVGAGVYANGLANGNVRAWQILGKPLGKTDAQACITDIGLSSFRKVAATETKDFFDIA